MGEQGLMKLMGAVWLAASCEGHIGLAPLSAQQLLAQPLLSPIITTMRVGFQATRGECVRHQATTRPGEVARFLQTQWPWWLPAAPIFGPASHPPPGAGRGGSPSPPTPPNRTAPRGRRRCGKTQCHRGPQRERRRRRR